MALQLRNTVLDARDARGPAEFYQRLLELVCAPGDEPPAGGGEEEVAQPSSDHRP